MTGGYTLGVVPPDAMAAAVPDTGAVPVTGWSFVRVRGARDTWHVIGTRRGMPWVSSEVVALGTGVVQTGRGRSYRLTGPSVDPTPDIVSVLHASMRMWGVPCIERGDP